MLRQVSLFVNRVKACDWQGTTLTFINSTLCSESRFLKKNLLCIWTLENLTTDVEADLRRFSLTAMRKEGQSHDIYQWGDTFSLLVISVDWTQSGTITGMPFYNLKFPIGQDTTEFMCIIVYLSRRISRDQTLSR